MDFQTIPAAHLHQQQPQLQPFCNINHNPGLGSIAEENTHFVDIKPEHFAPSEDSNSNSDGPSPDSNLPPHKRARINYECVECGTTYTEKRALARHRHTDMHRRRLGLQPDKRHLCLKCGRSFGRNHDLQRHRREQHGEATGANPIDLSSVASDGSEHRSLSSDESGKSMSGYSMASTMTAMTIPDELPPQSNLRSTRSLADFRKKSDEAKSSRSSSMDWSHTPIKTEPSPLNTIKAWPGEPAEEEPTAKGVMEPPSKKGKKPPRRHSSASLRDDKPPPPPTVSISPPESVSSRPSSSRSRQTSTSRPTLSKETSRNSADDVIDQVLNPRPKPKKLRETVLKSAIPTAPRDVESWLKDDPMTCMICGGKTFEEDETLLEHLQLHLESFKGKHKCKKCQVGFDHEEDLQYHLDCAASGHCGFKFEHATPCTGHHPPSPNAEEGKLSDPDCFRLWQQLKNWEQAQLQSYIHEINTLIAARDHRRKNRWSVEALFRNKRMSSHSFSSFAISVNTYASAPCDEINGDMDINGLQKRMKKMSLKAMGSNVVNKLQGGKYHPTKPLPPPSATYNKTLYRAIHRGDVKKAEEIINSGDGDPAGLDRASGTLTAAALWDHSEVQSLVVAHRLTEDIQGSCDVCHMNSATFQKGTNKIKALLAHGADANHSGGLCDFPILSAAWMCNDEVVNMLLGHGANVNQRDREGKFGSPLAVAASQAGHPGSLEVVGALLNAGASVEISGAEGSPLHLAKTRRQFWEHSAGEMLQLCPKEVDARVECCNQIIRGLEAAGARR